MTSSGDLECICIILGEFVTFRRADGSTVDVPHDVVVSSSLFGGYLAGATPGDSIALILRAGELQKWLQYLDLLLDREAQVLQLLRAADAVGDAELLKALSKQAAAWLFQKDPSATEKRAEVISKLPKHLITAILKASKLSSHDLLARTPDCLSTPAVHLLFPTIAMNGCLKLDDHDSLVGNRVLNPSSAHLLWPKLHAIPELNSLEFRGLKVGRSFNDLLKHLTGLTGLRRIDLGQNDLDDDKIAALMSAVAAIPQVEPLSLSDLIADLKDVNPNLPHLESLDLSENAMKSDGVVSVAVALRHLHTLKFLSLAFVDTSPDPYEALIKLASRLHHLTSLQMLDIRGVEMNDELGHTLSRYLSKISTLKKLCLGHNPLGDAGVTALSACFSKLPMLLGLEMVHVLDEYQTGLSSEAVRTLSKHLAQCTGLLQLDLGHNNFGNGSFVTLMSQLQHLPLLTGLKLEHNCVAAEGIKAAVQFFKPLKKLQLLCMDQKHMTEESVNALMPLPRMLTSLTGLCVSVNVLTHALWSSGMCLVFRPPDIEDLTLPEEKLVYGSRMKRSFVWES